MNKTVILFFWLMVWALAESAEAHIPAKEKNYLFKRQGVPAINMPPAATKKQEKSHPPAVLKFSFSLEKLAKKLKCNFKYKISYQKKDYQDLISLSITIAGDSFRGGFVFAPVLVRESESDVWIPSFTSDIESYIKNFCTSLNQPE